MNSISYLPPLSILIMSSCGFGFHLSSIHILHTCIETSFGKSYMLLYRSIFFNFMICTWRRQHYDNKIWSHATIVVKMLFQNMNSFFLAGSSVSCIFPQSLSWLSRLPLSTTLKSSFTFSCKLKPGLGVCVVDSYNVTLLSYYH